MKSEPFTICDLCIINDLCLRAGEHCGIEQGLGKIEGKYRVMTDGDDDIYGPNFKCSYNRRDEDTSGDNGHAEQRDLSNTQTEQKSTHYKIFR